MSNPEEKDQENSLDEEIVREADSIAAQITKMLVDAFKAKEGRDPTPEEVEQLIEEVTQERIEELLGGAVEQEQEQGEVGEGDHAGDDEEGDEGSEDEEREEEGEEEGHSDEDDEEPENADGNASNPFLSLPQGEVKVTVSGDLVKDHRTEDEENESKRRRIASD